MSPLVSAKSSDTGLHILLHPLVLLNISDHITRHGVRQQKGPIVGALLGQQQGRNVSLEHVFECKLIIEGEDVILDQEWFDTRLKQCMLLTRSALDLILMCLNNSQGCTQGTSSRSGSLVYCYSALRSYSRTNSDPSADSRELQRNSCFPCVPCL